MLKLSSSIKLVVSDFDGVFTDGSFYIDENLNQTKKLNFKDIMAFSLLKKRGFKIGIISGESNSAIEVLAKKFDIEEVHQGIRNKLDVLKSIIEKYKLSHEEFIYIGDDVNDYDSLCFAKYALSVPQAVEKVKSIPHIQITQALSGDGAFREVVEALISDAIS